MILACSDDDGEGAVVVLQRQRQLAADRWQNLKKGLRFWEGTPCVAESGATGN